MKEDGEALCAGGREVKREKDEKCMMNTLSCSLGLVWID